MYGPDGTQWIVSSDITRARAVGVAPDGRPWIWDDANPNVILRAR